MADLDDISARLATRKRPASPDPSSPSSSSSSSSSSTSSSTSSSASSSSSSSPVHPSSFDQHDHHHNNHHAHHSHSNNTPSTHPSDSSSSSAPTTTVSTPATDDLSPPFKKQHLQRRQQAKKGAKDFFSQLPVELACFVLSYLSYKSLAAMSAVNHHWRALTDQQGQILWYWLCQRHGYLTETPSRARPSTTMLEAAMASPSPSPSSSLLSSSRSPSQGGLWPKRLSIAQAKQIRQGFSRALRHSQLWVQESAATEQQQQQQQHHQHQATGSTGDSASSNIPTGSSQSQPLSSTSILASSSSTSLSRSATTAVNTTWLLEKSKVETWRDFFEASSTLEKRWKQGRPHCVELGLNGHQELILAVKLLPLGDRVISGDRSGVMQLWDVSTGTCLFRERRHGMGVSSFVFHGDILVSGSWDGNVIVWRQKLEEPYLEMLYVFAVGDPVVCLHLTPLLELAIGTNRGTVKVCSIAKLPIRPPAVETFTGAPRDLCTAIYMNESQICVAVGMSYYAWDRKTRARSAFMGDAHLQMINCMKIDTEKKLIITGSHDIRIFSWETRPMLLRRHDSHQKAIRCLTLQDDMIITGSYDKTVRLTFRSSDENFASKSGTKNMQLHPYVSLKYHPSGQDPLDREMDEDEDNEPVAPPVSLAHPAKVNAVDADASLLVSGAEDGVVRLYHFGNDLWRPPPPPAPKLCDQVSLVSSVAPRCVLMMKPSRANGSLGNRRQTWGNAALQVLEQAQRLLDEQVEEDNKNLPAGADPIPRMRAWMTVDEVFRRMKEWNMQPVSQGSTPKHTLNFALHMMARSSPPSVALDGTTSPHRFSRI
ncbi:hypothetical protein BGZ73_005149 [Actinomortierella ambigua]|nr:hypothetical protein BGZ73_005149 [Actinomortierella ambigua]